jgi:hypothetical protein
MGCATRARLRTSPPPAKRRRGSPPSASVLASGEAASGAPLFAASGAAPGAGGGGGGARRSIGGIVDTQSVGEDFARGLADDDLEQTIAYLIERRDRADLEPAARAVASANLDVLADEAARRGRTSPALDRAAVQTLLHDAAGGARELLGIVKQLDGNRDGLRNHPVTEQFLERTFERLSWVVNATSAGYGYVAQAASTGGQAGVALLGMAAARAHAAQVGLALLRPWCALLQLHDRVAIGSRCGRSCSSSIATAYWIASSAAWTRCSRGSPASTPTRSRPRAPTRRAT